MKTGIRCDLNHALTSRLLTAVRTAMTVDFSSDSYRVAQRPSLLSDCARWGIKPKVNLTLAAGSPFVFLSFGVTVFLSISGDQEENAVMEWTRPILISSPHPVPSF